MAPVAASMANTPSVLPDTIEKLTLLRSPVDATVPTADKPAAVSSTENSCAAVMVGATSATLMVLMPVLTVTPSVASTVSS